MITPSLSFEAALRMIPSYCVRTENELASYEAKCDFVFSNVSETTRPQIFQATFAQLTRSVFENVKYHEFQTWEQLKTHLRSIYETSHSVYYLQKRLNSLRQKYDENVHRQLTNVLSTDKTLAEARTIRLILKARGITSFRDAVCLAIETESIFDKTNTWKNNKPDNVRLNYYNRNRGSNESHVKCNKFNRMGHYANECRSSGSIGFRNLNNNPTENKIKYAGNLKFCKYCKRKNHDIFECKKRMYNEAKKTRGLENETNDQTIADVQNDVRDVTSIPNKEQINIISHNFVHDNLRFLINAESDMNVIQISSF